MTNTHPAIIIMAKAPRLGRAKTRLRGFLTDEEAETLTSAFFSDTLRYAQTTGVQIIIAFTPAGGSDELKRVSASAETLMWIEQADGDLGDRLASAAEFARSEQYWPVVFLGTDSPNLPVDAVLSALSKLESGQSDIVLGPSSDGGYYLIGLCRFDRDLLSRVPWGTADVFECTLTNATNLGYRPAVLAGWYDVDEPEDLRRLIVDVFANSSSAPATGEWLRRHRDLTFPDADDTSGPESQA